jgi:hypothetical protein
MRKSMMRIVLVVIVGALAVVALGLGCQSEGDTGTTGRAVECAADGSCPASEICVRGWCMPDCASDADCPAGVCVDGVCDFETEPWACAADTDCPAGATCVAGACVTVCTPAAEVCNGIDDDCDGVVDEDCSCAAGETMCGGACVDTLFDEMNCGACGMACAAGQSCLRGVCVVDTACTTDADCDDGDPATVDTCVAGVCDHGGACVPAAEVCNGLDDDCDGLVDEDPSCGGCGAGLTMCGGACFDLTADAANCGACGHACGVREVCNEGACVAGGGCTTDADCDDGDPATTDSCVSGMCTHDTPCVPAAEVCNGIDDDCDGLVDEDPACGACGVGLTMCGGACVDLLADELNCGACGSACSAGQTCLRGICTA